MHDKPPVPITAQQYQLLSSPMRLRILRVLADEPKTAKQVADEMGETRGNVHYHIQRLVDGGIVELTETRQAGSITEKYYRSRGTRVGSPRSRGSVLAWRKLKTSCSKSTWCCKRGNSADQRVTRCVMTTRSPSASFRRLKRGMTHYETFHKVRARRNASWRVPSLDSL